MIGNNFERIVQADDNEIVDELLPQAQQIIHDVINRVFDTIDSRLCMQMELGREISDAEWEQIEHLVPALRQTAKKVWAESMAANMGKINLRMECAMLRRAWAIHQAKKQAGQAGGASGAQ